MYTFCVGRIDYFWLHPGPIPKGFGYFTPTDTIRIITGGIRSRLQHLHWNISGSCQLRIIILKLYTCQDPMEPGLLGESDPI